MRQHTHAEHGVLRADAHHLRALGSKHAIRLLLMSYNDAQGSLHHKVSTLSIKQLRNLLGGLCVRGSSAADTVKSDPEVACKTASWCPPSRCASPAMHNMRAQYTTQAMFCSNPQGVKIHKAARKHTW
jgi:hypothetical protein